MKKYIFILAIGIGIFFLPHLSLADTLTQGVQTQSGLGSKFSVGDMMSSQCDDACAKAVPAGASWAKEDSCVSATCWCKGSDGAVASGRTSNQGCKKLCSDKSQDFVSWGESPPSPPGGGVLQLTGATVSSMSTRCMMSVRMEPVG